MPAPKEVVIIIKPTEMWVRNEKASVTLMEWGEYESEECAKANEVVKQILEKYEGKIRFQFRHFPLTKMHHILYQNRRNLGTTSLKLYSREAGISDKNFLDNLVNGTYGWQVQDDIKEGIGKGVKELPAFFVNDEPIGVKPTFDNLSKAIDNALKSKGKKKPAAKKRA